MIINNHFIGMDIVDKLNRKLLKQDFIPQGKAAYQEELEMYKGIARGYAVMENAVAVLSDMRSDFSYIYYGGFARTLGLAGSVSAEQVDSIWEENILRLIHPDDLHEKYLQELRFLHWISRLPEKNRKDYYLSSRLRMRDASGNYQPALHRMFYVPAPWDRGLWLALCLYNPLLTEFPEGCVVVHAVTGQVRRLEKCHAGSILTEREKQVLRLIDQGMMSKTIAEQLSISVNTVSRHRQEILKKLRVSNSIEACRVARELDLF